MLGLPYPGGPAIQRPPQPAIPRPTPCPAPSSDDERLDFSFSGLKTAVRYTIAGPGRPDFASLSYPAAGCRPGRQLSRGRGRLPGGQGVCGVRKTGLGSLRGRRRGGQCPAARATRAKRPTGAACTSRGPLAALHRQRRDGRHRRGALKAGLFELLDLDVYPGVVLRRRITGTGPIFVRRKWGCPPCNARGVLL